MQTYKLEAKKRDVIGKRLESLRGAGALPGVVYGHGVESRPVTVDGKTFEKLFAAAGESTLVDLAVNGDEPVKVLIQDVQYDPIKGTLLHVDFRQVRMTEKLEAEVNLKFVGEAPAVKEKGGTLVRSLDSITVRCLPADLVHEIEVDLSGLKEFEDSISIGDLTPPKGIEFMADPGDTIAVVEAPMTEEEIAALDAAPVTADVSAVKVATEEKKAEREAEKKEEEA